jgi:hypothetical protein
MATGLIAAQSDLKAFSVLSIGNLTGVATKSYQLLL